MRVISGKKKGINLNAPKGNSTRPTTDKIKEAIFSMIQFELVDATCLDLFAGSGSLGIEAISRGAKTCFLVEKNRKSFEVIKENIKKTQFENECFLIFANAFEFVNEYNYHLQKNYELNNIKKFYKKENLIKKQLIFYKKFIKKFDIVFLDPPYNKGFINKFFEISKNLDIFNKNCIFVIEKDKNDIVNIDEKFILIKEKNYSNISVNIYRYK